MPGHVWSAGSQAQRYLRDSSVRASQEDQPDDGQDTAGDDERALPKTKPFRIEGGGLNCPDDNPQCRYCLRSGARVLCTRSFVHAN